MRILLIPNYALVEIPLFSQFQYPPNVEHTWLAGRTSSHNHLRSYFPALVARIQFR